MEDSPIQENNVSDFNFSKNKFPLRVMFFYVIFLFLFLIAIYYFLFSAPLKFPNGIVVEVEKGQNLRQLSLDLKNKKIIRSRFSFETFLIIYGGERYISTGDYFFEGKLPVFEVARRIAKKDRRLASVKITIPEGFNNLQIAENVSLKLKNFNKDNFLQKAKQGYLFPDTYFFFSSDDEQDVLKYLNENYIKKMKNVKNEIYSSGKKENEVIVMASIIEREAEGDNDRAYISGILWSRIKKNMPLQVDAAPDTYKTRGLPKEPICNPGMEAIMASIHPIETSYLYYLHDKNGGIHYAKTYEEHKKNKAKYLK